MILEKVASDTYHYFLSPNFDSTKLEDLISIYKHLMAVKREILTMVDEKRKSTSRQQ